MRILKKAIIIHSQLKQHLQELVNAGAVPTWMTEVGTVLIMIVKGTAVGNYRPIACLPLMWKLLTSIFSEAIYGHLSCLEIMPNEQKLCRKNSRGTKDQPLIDKAILKNFRRTLTNLSIAWMNYRKAYDIMVPNSWLFGIFKNGWSGPEYNHLDREQNGKLEDSVNVNLGQLISKEGPLSPYPFGFIVLTMSLILRDKIAGYQIKKERYKINHLIFMVYMKLYRKNSSQIDSLIQTFLSYSEDME